MSSIPIDDLDIKNIAEKAEIKDEYVPCHNIDPINILEVIVGEVEIKVEYVLMIMI